MTEESVTVFGGGGDKPRRYLDFGLDNPEAVEITVRRVEFMQGGKMMYMMLGENSLTIELCDDGETIRISGQS